MTGEAEALCQFEDDPGIRPGFAQRIDGRGAQLNKSLGVLVDLETDAQAFALPCAGGRQNDVGERRGGGHEQVSVDEEVECCEGLARAVSVGVGDDKIGAEARRDLGLDRGTR